MGAGGAGLTPPHLLQPQTPPFLLRLFSRFGVHLRRAEGAAERTGDSGFVEQPVDSHRHGLPGDDAGE